MTNKPSPLKIRLAIQGGGAKIAALLATMEAIQDLQRQNIIQVIEVIGTSAGAIVGAFLAADIDIAKIKDSLAHTNGKQLVAHYKVSAPALLYRLFFGKPAWNDKKLRQWLSDIFDSKKITTIGDLKKAKNINFTPVSTDLSNRTPHFLYDDNKNLVSALLDSSGLPYLFRVWGHNNSNAIIVDGGLCENLPAPLLDEDENCSTVAISFKKRPTDNPTSLFSFSAALLDVAIESSMEKARKGLSGHLYEIDTHLTTFGFEDALKTGLGDHYLLKKKEALDWFNALASSKSRSLPVMRNPWLETNDTARFLMNSLSKIYQSHHLKSKYILYQMKCVVEANCLIDEGMPFFGSPARLMYELEISALPNSPIYCIYYALLNEPEGSLLTSDTLHIRAHKNHTTINTFQVPTRNNDSALKEILIFFEQPVTQDDGLIRISVTEQVVGLVSKLRLKGMDNISYSNPRAAGGIKEAFLVLNYPTAFGDLTINPSQGKGEQITDLDVNKYDLASKNQHFRSIGYVFRDVGEDEKIEMIMSKGKGDRFI